MQALLSPRAGALHYRVDGPADAPALLFCNSLSTDLRLWDAVLARLPDRLRVVRFDKRGHGLSAPPTTAFSIEDLAEDALEIADAVGLDRFAFFGISIGGMVGQALAARAPDRLTALGLLATGARIGDAALWNARIAAAKAGGVEALADAIVDRWFPAAFKADPARVAPWRAMVARTTTAGYVECCAAIRDADLAGAARPRTTPTLSLWGSKDLSTSPDVNRALADLIGAQTRVELSGSGHLPCIDNPERTAREIRQFLSQAGILPV